MTVLAAPTAPKALTVLHSVPSWLPQTQTWLHTQTRFLPDSIDSHVVCERTEHLDQFNVPNIHSLGTGPRWRVVLDRFCRGVRMRRYPGHLPAVARQAGAEILHSHFGHVGWLDLGAARRCNLHQIVTFYGQDLNYLPRQDPRWNRRYAQLFDAAHLVLCEGPHMARCIVDLGCPEGKVRVHHLGVDTTKIAFRPRQWDGVRPLRVLLAASFTEKKGLTYGLRALGRLVKDIPLTVTVIGDANREERNQAEKRRILDAIHQAQLPVRLLGYQPHKVLFEQAYYHDVFLSPSVTAADGDTEGGAPVAIIEMAASGMPIVSTRHCDIPEVLPGGLLAAERDPDELYSLFAQLVATPDGWGSRCRSAREHIELEYDAARQGEALARIYEEVAATGSSIPS